MRPGVAHEAPLASRRHDSTSATDQLVASRGSMTSVLPDTPGDTHEVLTDRGNPKTIQQHSAELRVLVAFASVRPPGSTRWSMSGSRQPERTTPARTGTRVATF